MGEKSPGQERAQTNVWDTISDIECVVIRLWVVSSNVCAKIVRFYCWL